MILIGQYDSPFVRRVAIALRLYGSSYDHRPWSTFGDAERIASHNPLRRVPTLVLDEGEALIETTAILDYLDELAGPSRALIARSGPARRHALKICALATGLSDKAVSLIYERLLHRQTSTPWVERCEVQIRGALNALEADRRHQSTAYWLEDRIGHPDIAVACTLRFLCEAHPGTFEDATWPGLTAHAKSCEALEPFRAIAQPFLPPNWSDPVTWPSSRCLAGAAEASPAVHCYRQASIFLPSSEVFDATGLLGLCSR
jgi:glutathione S-transferase